MNKEGNEFLTPENDISLENLFSNATGERADIMRVVSSDNAANSHAEGVEKDSVEFESAKQKRKERTDVIMEKIDLSEANDEEKSYTYQYIYLIHVDFL